MPFPNSSQGFLMEEGDLKCDVCRKRMQQSYPLSCCEVCHSALKNEGEDEPLSQTPIPPPIIIQGQLEQNTERGANESGCVRSKKKKARIKYYKSMDSWVSMMKNLEAVKNDDIIPSDANEITKGIKWATYIHFSINVLLTAAKAYALATSTSYTIIASLADSVLDIIAGILISCTAAHSNFTAEDLNLYPVGKSMVSTVGLLIFAVIMSCAALFIIIECIIGLADHRETEGTSEAALIVLIVTIGVKLILCIVYYCLKNPITTALAEDDRNDVITNSFGLFMYWGSSIFVWWMDEVGGIVISLFVCISWIVNIVKNARMLMGKSAPDDIIRSVSFIAASHHPLIKDIEQITAFQVGTEYFVELHIVIPGNVPLHVAHYIGESLQLKVEKIPRIARAWVHVDCEISNISEHILLLRASRKHRHERV